MRFDDLVKQPPKSQRALTYTESLQDKLNQKLADRLSPGLNSDLDEGWKDLAAAGVIGLGALGAQSDAVAKYSNTTANPKVSHTAMGPAAKADPTLKLTAKTPVSTKKAASLKKTEPKTDGNSVTNGLSMNSEPEHELQRAAIKAGIKGTELAQFMAQTRHESADFTRMKELGGDKYFNKLYDPQTSPRTAKILGNTKVGDGIRYHGRGFIQITGRDNYRMAGSALGLPLEQKPELASNPKVAAKIAVWYWKTRVKPHVQNFNDTAAVTRAINPAMRGLQDRHTYFQDYKKIV